MPHRSSPTMLCRFSMLALATMVVSHLAAQPPRRDGGGLRERILRDDRNGDGQITRAEFQGPSRLFQRLDANGDGILSKTELDRLPARSPKRRAVVVPENVEILRDIEFGKGGDRALKMHLVRPKQRSDQPLPVYIWIHGGGWRRGSKEAGLARLIRMARLGFAGATIEYRLSGEATFPAQIEDCKCAVRFLRAHAGKYGLDPDHMAVGGSSAGGHLAALVGTSAGVESLEGKGGWSGVSSRVHAVVDFYGPTDLIRFAQTPGYERHAKEDSPEARLLGGPPLKMIRAANQANPITYVDADDPPFLIIHGSQDRTVPPNQSRLLHEALKKAGVSSQLHIIEGAGHGGRAFSEPQITKMEEEFLQKTIGGKARG